MTGLFSQAKSEVPEPQTHNFFYTYSRTHDWWECCVQLHSVTSHVVKTAALKKRSAKYLQLMNLWVKREMGDFCLWIHHHTRKLEHPNHNPPLFGFHRGIKSGRFALFLCLQHFIQHVGLLRRKNVLNSCCSVVYAKRLWFEIRAPLFFACGVGETTEIHIRVGCCTGCGFS